MSLQLASPAFAAGEIIPTRHTADGADASVPLTIRGAPEGTRSFALVVEDPGAPGGLFVHWLVWNVPPETRALPPGVKAEQFLQGTNDYGRVGWGGPKPPRGDGAHRYVFRLHALDTLLDVEPGARREALEAAMHGHGIESATLTGKYWRDR
jgi:Raf kinase inhibitor-like YbhB/YbcL family protein